MLTLRFLMLSLSALALGCAVSLEGNASSSMYRVRVMQSDNLPCFALQDGAQTRRHASQLVMLHVVVPQSAAMARDGRVAWSIGFPPPPAAVRTLQNDECFVYGDTPSGSDLMVAAEELQYGVGYRVTLNIDLLKSGRPENRQYSGDFCLSEQADGSIRVHDLWGGDVAEAPAGDACRDLYRPARE